MLSVTEIAKLLDVHVTTVRVWIQQGLLPASRKGEKGHYRVAESDLKTFRRRRRLSVTQAASLLGITEATTYRMLKSGELEGQKVAGRWYVTDSKLVRALMTYSEE